MTITSHVSHVLELPLFLDHDANEPLHRQLVTQLREAILQGNISAGTRLPSTRSLALLLHVSRTVTIAAYDELFAEGYIEGRHGSGTYVVEDLSLLKRSPFPSPAGPPRWLRSMEPLLLPRPVEPQEAINFRPGTPDMQFFPERTWRELWRQVGHAMPPNAYGEPAGLLELRTEIAAYLGRARGIACQAEDIIITSGATQAVNLIVQATLVPGDTVALEEPGYPLARYAFRASGLHIVPIPVDDDGLEVSQLANGEDAPYLVYVTPSHQYPLGSRLSSVRRVALLQWAEANDSLVIEDDYDGEFRFHAPPLPALASMDRAGRVVYIGTFSKVLMPGLRVGYLVATAPLRERIVRLKRMFDYHVTWPTQYMLAAMLRDGHLERHIRRMRLHYAEKRRQLAEIFAPIASRARLCGLEAGMHVFLELHPALDAYEIAREASARDVYVPTLDEYYTGMPDRNGLLLGYGALDAQQIRTGAQTLIDLINKHR